MRVSLIVLSLVVLFGAAPRRTAAQDISLTLVGTNVLESERGTGAYPEVEVAFPVARDDDGRYELLVAAHVATWRERQDNFRCTHYCPDLFTSAQLVGARLGLESSINRIHGRAAVGLGRLGALDVGDGVRRMTVVQSTASLGVEIAAWFRPTAAVHMRRPLRGSRRPAIGRISFGLGLKASFR